MFKNEKEVNRTVRNQSLDGTTTKQKLTVQDIEIGLTSGKGGRGKRSYSPADKIRFVQNIQKEISPSLNRSRQAYRSLFWDTTI